MGEEKLTFSNIDEYLQQFPIDIQKEMGKLREVIKEAAPQATEKISYQMPTFYLYGNLVHFAVFKNHVGLYPGASGIEMFLPKLKDYKTSKGTIQFPLDKPIPYDLISEIVRFRVEENTMDYEHKSKNKKKK